MPEDEFEIYLTLLAKTMRLKDDQDGAEPATNSVAAANLVRLASLLDKPDLAAKADGIFGIFHERLTKIPLALPEMARALLARGRVTAASDPRMTRTTSSSHFEKPFCPIRPTPRTGTYSNFNDIASNCDRFGTKFFNRAFDCHYNRC